MGDYSLLATRIRELRNKLKLTQSEFSEDICTSATLSAYENGSKNPSLEIVKNIALKYNVSIDWLCGLTEKKTLENEINTYSDILNILVKLDSAIALDIKDSQYHDILGFLKDGKCIVFDSEYLQEFLNEWHYYRNLFHDKNIDKGIYQACLEKLFRDSNIVINEERDYPFL